MPASSDERAVLEVLRAPDGHRLACQALMRPGVARLRIGPVRAPDS
jgi:ferredoxin